MSASGAARRPNGAIARTNTIDASKTTRECGWEPKHSFETGLAATVRWYLANEAWVDGVRSGDYLRWMQDNYGKRGSAGS